MKFAQIIVALLLLSACSKEEIQTEYTYSQPSYFLTFEGPDNLEWEVNGIRGTSDSLNVSEFTDARVKIKLSQIASVSCTLFKGEYPTFYYIVTCNPDSTYEFNVRIK